MGGAGPPHPPLKYVSTMLTQDQLSGPVAGTAVTGTRIRPDTTSTGTVIIGLNFLSQPGLTGLSS